MTFLTLFATYLALVIVAAAAAVGRWLTGRARLATIATLVIWLSYAGILGGSGAVSHYHELPLGIALLTLPVVLILLVLTLSGSGAALSRQIPLQLLLGFQVFRIGVELSLHHLWTLGLAPRILTLEGGNIEILVAITAPVAAWLAARRSLGCRIAWVWNLVGILSLINVVVRAVLSAPGPLQIIHAEVPDVAILTFPFTFIPGFMAPLALALHVLAFRAFGARYDDAVRTV